jgi:hypothetical protein
LSHKCPTWRYVSRIDINIVKLGVGQTWFEKQTLASW